MNPVRPRPANQPRPPLEPPLRLLAPRPAVSASQPVLAVAACSFAACSFMACSCFAACSSAAAAAAGSVLNKVPSAIISAISSSVSRQAVPLPIATTPTSCLATRSLRKTLASDRGSEVDGDR